MRVPKLTIAPKFGQTDPVGDMNGPVNQNPFGGLENPPINAGAPLIGGAPVSSDPYDSDSEILYFLSKEKNAIIFIAVIVALVVGLYLYLK